MRKLDIKKNVIILNPHIILATWMQKQHNEYVRRMRVLELCLNLHCKLVSYKFSLRDNVEKPDSLLMLFWQFCVNDELFLFRRVDIEENVDTRYLKVWKSRKREVFPLVILKRQFHCGLFSRWAILMNHQSRESVHSDLSQVIRYIIKIQVIHDD